MIQGRFVKNGEVTEIIIGNGMTELVCDEEEPIKHFEWEWEEEKRKKKPILTEILLVASAVVPFCIGIYLAVECMADHTGMAMFFLFSQLWMMAFMFANTK